MTLHHASIVRTCMLTTLSLAFVSVASKLAIDGMDSPLHKKAASIMERSMHWHNVSLSESSDPVLAYQHATTSLAYFTAARELVSDAELEQITGQDVSLLWRSKERRLTQTRQRVLLGQEALLKQEDDEMSKVLSNTSSQEEIERCGG